MFVSKFLELSHNRTHMLIVCLCQKENPPPVEKPVKIQIPSALKKQLVDDWEFINHQDKVGVS